MRAPGTHASSPSSHQWSICGASTSVRPARPIAAQSAAAALRSAPTPRARVARTAARAASPRATLASATPNATTIVAPVGRSQIHDAASPPTLTRTPSVQPTESRPHAERASAAAAAAGTTRYAKTSSTPATRTELVTTTPNDA